MGDGSDAEHAFLSRRLDTVENKVDKLDDKGDRTLTELTRIATVLENIVANSANYTPRSEFDNFKKETEAKQESSRWWLRMVAAAVVGAFATSAASLLVVVVVGKGHL